MLNGYVESVSQSDPISQRPETLGSPPASPRLPFLSTTPSGTPKARNLDKPVVFSSFRDASDVVRVKKEKQRNRKSTASAVFGLVGAVPDVEALGGADGAGTGSAVKAKRSSSRLSGIEPTQEETYQERISALERDLAHARAFAKLHSAELPNANDGEEEGGTVRVVQKTAHNSDGLECREENDVLSWARDSAVDAGQQVESKSADVYQSPPAFRNSPNRLQDVGVPATPEQAAAAAAKSATPTQPAASGDTSYPPAQYTQWIQQQGGRGSPSSLRRSHVPDPLDIPMPIPIVYAASKDEYDEVVDEVLWQHHRARQSSGAKILSSLFDYSRVSWTSDTSLGPTSVSTTSATQPSTASGGEASRPSSEILSSAGVAGSTSVYALDLLKEQQGTQDEQPKQASSPAPTLGHSPKSSALFRHSTPPPPHPIEPMESTAARRMSYPNVSTTNDLAATRTAAPDDLGTVGSDTTAEAPLGLSISPLFGAAASLPPVATNPRDYYWEYLSLKREYDFLTQQYLALRKQSFAGPHTSSRKSTSSLVNTPSERNVQTSRVMVDSATQTEVGTQSEATKEISDTVCATNALGGPLGVIANASDSAELPPPPPSLISPVESKTGKVIRDATALTAVSSDQPKTTGVSLTSSTASRRLANKSSPASALSVADGAKQADASQDDQDHWEPLEQSSWWWRWIAGSSLGVLGKEVLSQSPLPPSLQTVMDGMLDDVVDFFGWLFASPEPETPTIAASTPTQLQAAYAESDRRAEGDELS